MISLTSLQFHTAELILRLERGFAKILSSRSVTIFALHVDELWTKQELKKVVKILDTHEYFSMLALVCQHLGCPIAILHAAS